MCQKKKIKVSVIHLKRQLLSFWSVCTLFSFLLFLNTVNLVAQNTGSATATYTSGHIQTDRNLTSLPGVSSCFGELVVTIPEGAVITGVDVEYDMTTGGGGNMSDQRSYLRCKSPGGKDEPHLSAGSGNSGTYSYERTSLDIANDVLCGGDIIFRLHAGRTRLGNDCDPGHNRVDNNTWKVTVHYIEMDENSEISNNPSFFIDSISSTKTAYADRVLVMEVKISDLGSGDNSPTVIDSLYITQGAYNEFDDWRDYIAGATLYGHDLGGNTGVELHGYLYENKIVFKDAAILSVPDGQSEVYQLRIWLLPTISSAYDNKKLDFLLETENIFSPVCLPSSKFEDFGVATSGPIAMYFPRDANSTIIEGDGERPSNIKANHASFGDRITVFDIKFVDMGSGDGADTKVERIVFTRGRQTK